MGGFRAGLDGTQRQDLGCQALASPLVDAASRPASARVRKDP